MFQRLSLLVVVLVFTLAAVAQQSGCTNMDLAVNVIKSSGEPVTDLSVANFSVQVKRQSLAIESAKYGGGPRRILFVIDTTKKLSPDARRLAVVFASALVAAAQPEDTFALITARGITQTVKFGADRSEITKALNVLNESAGESGDNHSGPLDALTEGVGWFGEPRVGDAIVVIAANLEGNHKANPKSVAKLVGEHGIRLFGVALGPLQLQNSTTAAMGLDKDGFGYRQPGMPMVESDADANFFPLSLESGGYIAPMNTLGAKTKFELTDAARRQGQSNGQLMARLIDKFYDLRVQAPSASRDEQANVSLDKGHATPGVHLLFPHTLGACASSVAAR